MAVCNFSSGNFSVFYGRIYRINMINIKFFKKYFVAAALMAVMLFQLNHLAVMNLTSSHDAASQCATQQKQNPEKCLCCVLEQADKNQQVFNQQNFNLIPVSPPSSILIEPVAVPPKKQSTKNKSSPKHFKWLRTVVQNK